MRAMAGTVVLCGAVLVGLAVRPAARASQPQPEKAAPAAVVPQRGGGGGAQQAPKNIQVLPKDWTGQQVSAYMRNTVAPGLGVTCNFCHTQDRSADDLKPKLVARKMIQMTDAINNEYLKDVGEPAAAGSPKVTCYTCHRGSQHPLTAPPSSGGLLPATR